jgi:hypothetical protein
MWKHPGRTCGCGKGRKSLLKVRGKVTNSHGEPAMRQKQRKESSSSFQVLLKPALIPIIAYTLSTTKLEIRAK